MTLTAERPAAVTVSRETTFYVPLDRIVDNPYQPRLGYEPESLQDLAAGIAGLKAQLRDTLGLQQIPVARWIWAGGGDPGPVAIDQYYKFTRDIDWFAAYSALAVQLHFGHRRLRAFRLLAETDPDYAAMPVRIAYASEYDMWRHAATENARRVGLNAIERARSMQAAMTGFGLAVDEAAEPYGYSRSAASNSLRLLKLPPSIQQAVAADDLSEKHARTLLRLEDAPHLLMILFERAQTNEWSTRLLEEHVRETIGDCPPAPDTPVEEEDTEYTFKRTRTVAMPWPMNFGPGHEGWDLKYLSEAQCEKVQGACAGCAYRVQFHGESYARCTLSGCYEIKRQLWRDWEVRQQQNALKQKATTTYWSPEEPAPEPGEAPTQADPSLTAEDAETLIRRAMAEQVNHPELDAYRGSSWSLYLGETYHQRPMIDTCRRAIKQVMRTPTIEAAPAVEQDSVEPDEPLAPTLNVPEEKIRGHMNGSNVTWFGSYHNASPELLEKGLCSPERCECYVLAYNDYPNDRNVRPDPENAPNMCVGCTSDARRAARKRELEKLQSDDGLTKKQAARAEAKANRARIEALLEEIGGSGLLWTNVAFLHAAFKAINRTLNSNLRIDLDGGSLEELQRAVYLAVAHDATGCYFHDLGDYDVDREKVDTFLGRLRIPLQPGPGDSQKTGWEVGWDGDDALPALPSL